MSDVILNCSEVGVELCAPDILGLNSLHTLTSYAPVSGNEDKDLSHLKPMKSKEDKPPSVYDTDFQLSKHKRCPVNHMKERPMSVVGVVV